MAPLLVTAFTIQISNMSKPKRNITYTAVPSRLINKLSSSCLHSLLVSPNKSFPPSSSKNSNRCFGYNLYGTPRVWFLVLFLVGIFLMLRMGYNIEPLIPGPAFPCITSQPQALNSDTVSRSTIGLSTQRHGKGIETQSRLLFNKGYSDMPRAVLKEEMKVKPVEEEFWKQPDGMGYRPCLDFSEEYKTQGIIKNRRKYLLVVVSGGLNQQRNQIVDAVVIARILEATLVVPILQVNVIWGDESEFSDIFDLEHFKKVLANDVRVVSSLPSTHIRARYVVEKQTPMHISAESIRSRYLRKLQKERVLLLRSLDSRLSKDLAPDLQKLRCKVAFQAMRFTPRILGLGNKLVQRMKSKGPYLALHLRMEKDVWVRTGCLPGLSRKYDELVNSERIRHPELLTGRSNMTYQERKLAGLCPLNAMELTRLIKVLGAPKNGRIYWAGGQPLGGKEALLPLIREFPHLYNKEDIALPGELEPFANKASILAAIDYIICEKSDVFMPSHGGNMGHALQGHRAYAGHKKNITPNKRHMLPFFLNSSLPEVKFNRIVKELHKDSMGQPELRIGKSGRDVTKFPIPECMCNGSTRAHQSHLD